MRKNQCTGLAGLLIGLAAAAITVTACSNRDSPVGPAIEQTATRQMNASATQGAILRLRAVEDMAGFLEELRTMGVTVVSSGKGATVVEAPLPVLEALQDHPKVLAVDTPKQMQMRSPPSGSD